MTSLETKKKILEVSLSQKNCVLKNYFERKLQEWKVIMGIWHSWLKMQQLIKVVLIP